MIGSIIFIVGIIFSIIFMLAVNRMRISASRIKQNSINDLRTSKVIISDSNLLVQPLDYTKFVTISFKAKLNFDCTSLKGFMYDSVTYENFNTLKSLLIFELEMYIRSKVTFNDLAHGVSNKMRVDIINHWNSILHAKKEGWLVTEVEFKLMHDPPISNLTDRYRILLYLSQAKAEIECTVILSLNDAGKYMIAEIKNMYVWVKEQLRQCSQTILRNVTYGKLVSSSEMYSGVIKHELDIRAQRIGFTVEHLSISDPIRSEKLKFSIQLENAEKEFATNLNDRIKLNVLVFGHIKNFNNNFWVENLKPGVDFLGIIKQDILWVVKISLLRVNSDEFYTEFNKVADHLSGGIKDILVNKYNVDNDVDVVISMEESDLFFLIKDLQKNDYEARVNLFGEALQYEIKYKVNGVDANYWQFFAQKSSMGKAGLIKNISEILIDYIFGVFQSKYNNINLASHPDITALIMAIAKKSVSLIRDATGLHVEILYLKQTVNKVENNFLTEDAVLLNEVQSARLKMIRNLDFQLLDVIKDRPDEVSRLLEKKHILEEQIRLDLAKSQDRIQFMELDIRSLISAINSE